MNPFIYKQTAFILGVLGMGLSNVQAEMPGFDNSVPNQITLKVADEKRPATPDGISMKDTGKRQIDMSATGSLQMQNGDTIDTINGDVVLRVGVDLGLVLAEAEISLEDIVNEALDEDYESNGRVLRSSISEALPKDTLHRLVAVVTPFQYRRDGNQFAEVTVVLGRDNATPLGSFIVDWQPGFSNLLPRQLSEQDLVKVSASTHQGMLKNTVVEIASFGHDVLGYYSDAKEDRGQSGDNSWAISATKAFELEGGNALEVYVSYAHLDKNLIFARATDANQPTASEEGTMIAAGARFTADRLTISAEGYRLDTDALDDPETGIEVQAMYDVERLIPFAKYQLIDDRSSQDSATTVGVGYEVSPNVMIAAAWEHSFKESGDDENNFNINVSLTESKEEKATNPTE